MSLLGLEVRKERVWGEVRGEIEKVLESWKKE
jgi:hypothetical protein